MITLAGKTAFVTGGGRGIGREISLVLAEAGADVGVCDIDLASAEGTARSIEQAGRRGLALQADVSSGSDVAAMFTAYLKVFEKIDILVNNAGITRDGLIMRMKEADWDAVLAVNLKSAYLCCREVARHMMKTRSGAIINIASVSGIMGNPGQANYSASKAGIIGLTKSLAREFASRNIRVNAVAPGFIQTAMVDKLGENEKERIARQIPLQTLGTPRDVANVVAFLASGLSGYMTGQVCTVSGGLVM